MRVLALGVRVPLAAWLTGTGGNMDSKAKALGHPMHPMLVVFPLGLLTTALIFDLVYLITDNAVYAQVGYWDIAAGLIGAALAAMTGLVDFLAIPSGTRAKRIGLLHGSGNAVIAVLFLIVWLTRLGDNDHTVGAAGFVVELIAIAMASVTGWLGGELVDRLGVGVHPGANVNSPNSLSHEPVSSKDGTVTA
jgi:uncharacterized membrane protein